MGIYYNNNLFVTLDESLSFISPHFESIFIDVQIESTKLTLGSIYRPPGSSSNIRDFVSNFSDQILDKISNPEVIICGDFNIDLNCISSPQITDFVTEMESHNFFNIITHNTRVQYHTDGNIRSSTLIDLIWTSGSLIDSSCVIDYHLSDHYPLGCFLDIPRDNETKLIERRRISDNLLDPFRRRFLDFKNNFSITGDPNKLFPQTIEFLSSLIKFYFPIEKIKVKNKKLKRPWFDETLDFLIAKKYRIYKKCKSGTLPFSRYKAYRNLLNRNIRIAKKLYFLDKFENINNNSKLTWRIINDVSNPTKSNKNIIIKEGSSVTQDGTVLSDKFLDLFFPSSDPSTGTEDTTGLIDTNRNTFFCRPFTPQEVYNTLFNMKNNSILSDLPIKILKLLGEPLCSLLSDLFNHAISCKNFPNILKMGTITPIPKKGNAKNIKNYRPITILNPISKIFDKLLYDRLYSFFDNCNVLSNYQFGFRKKRGIEQAALNLIYNINKANENNETCVAVFIDLTKAFNNVDLYILLNKLFKYGIRGDMLAFFDSYLKNRNYRTKVNGKFSKYITSNRGVGQDTNIGLLFFNIFVNDVERVIEHCRIFIYADDLVLVKSSRDLNLLKNCINSDLDNLYQFFSRNNQYVNFTKTQAMLFTRKKM